MVKEVIRSPKFIQNINKIDQSYLERIEKVIIKIIANPDIGKPMRYDKKGTREVYVPPFRLFYFYDNNQEILYLLEIYHKDKQ